MNIRKFVVVNTIGALLFAFGPQQAAAQNNPCAESRGKRMVKGGGGGAILGGLLGGVFGGLKGAAIGAGAGAAAGAAVSAKKPAACSNPAAAAKGPYNQAIANANEPAASGGPGVLLRNVYGGADRTAIEPILIQSLPKRGYGFIDEALYRQDRDSASVQYYLDVIVKQRGNTQGSDGGGFFRSSWAQSGNRTLGRGIYQVSVVMTSAQTGRPDPSRTATMTINATTYGSSNGNYTVANVYGYGSQSVWSSDPATGAAIAAINFFFGK